MALVIIALGLGGRRTDPAKVGIENVDLVFLTAVVIVRRCAAAMWAVLLASGRGVVVLQFLFLPPVYTFTITDPNQRRSLSSLQSDRHPGFQCRGRACARRPLPRDRQGATTESLYAFSRKLAGTATLDDRIVGERLSNRVDAEGGG
jgi:two-component system sensor histidine kinase KdpD